jgi:D-sedoheptulose 7-phosphate isomerase
MHAIRGDRFMLKSLLEESIAAKQALLLDEQFWNDLDRVVLETSGVLLRGNKLLIAGNGGSAADAQHFATEIVATLEKEERRGYPALALTTDTSFLTAWVNDFGPDRMFARQVEAFGKEGDVFYGISTSGNSRNVLLAAEQARKMGMRVIGLLGGDGGALKQLSDISLSAPTSVTARIQECHGFMIHAISKGVVDRIRTSG